MSKNTATESQLAQEWFSLIRKFLAEDRAKEKRDLAKKILFDCQQSQSLTYKDENGNNALHLLLQMQPGKDEATNDLVTLLAFQLIEKNPDLLSLSNHRGKTPIDLAIENNPGIIFEIDRRCVGYPATSSSIWNYIAQPDANNDLPLHVLLRKPDKTPEDRALLSAMFFYYQKLDNGLELINKPDGQGRLPVELAIAGGDMEGVNLLVYGLESQKKTDSLGTLVKKNFTETINVYYNLFVNHSTRPVIIADLTKRTSEGLTPHFFAVKAYVAAQEKGDEKEIETAKSMARLFVTKCIVKQDYAAAHEMIEGIADLRKEKAALKDLNYVELANHVHAFKELDGQPLSDKDALTIDRLAREKGGSKKLDFSFLDAEYDDLLKKLNHERLKKRYETKLPQPQDSEPEQKSEQTEQPSTQFTTTSGTSTLSSRSGYKFME